MFIIFIVSLLGHLSLSMIAQQRTKICILGFLLVIRALFTMKATPALVHRLCGSLEYRMSKKHFLKQLLMVSTYSSLRWVF